MKSNAELIDMLKAHKKFEANMVNLVASLEGKVHTRAAKLLLAEMRLDSRKHEAILDEVLNALEDKPQPQHLWETRIESYVDMQVMKQELEKHMQLEADMLRDAEKEIRETQDEALKTLLTHIAEDEKKHHKNIELIIRKSYSFSS
jgi:rubrerythrin